MRTKRDLMKLAGRIASYIARNGSGPTVREVSGFLGRKSSCSGQHALNALIGSGLIVKIPGQPRGIKMTEEYINTKDNY